MSSPTGVIPRMMTLTMTLTTTRTTQIASQWWWWASAEPCDDQNVNEDSELPSIDRKGAANCIAGDDPSPEPTSASQNFTVTQTPSPPSQSAPAVETSSLDPATNGPWATAEPTQLPPPLSTLAQSEPSLNAPTSSMPPNITIATLPAPSTFPDTQLESSAPAPGSFAPPNEATPTIKPPPSTATPDSALTSVETATVGAAVPPESTASPAANITHSPSPASADAGDDNITLPVGGFAATVAVAGLLGVVFLVLAVTAWRRRRRRQAEAQRSVVDEPSTGTFTPLKGQSQRASGHSSTLEAGTANNEGQTLRDAEHVRLSVFPGWPKRIAQIARGQGRRNHHVDFEMVTSDQAAR